MRPKNGNISKGWHKSGPIGHQKAESATDQPATVKIPSNRGVDGGAQIPIFGDAQPFVDNGYGTQIPVKLFARMKVYRQLRFGQLPVRKMSGFKDELSGEIITNAFSVGLLDPEDIERNWKHIDDECEAIPKPVIVLRGVLCWDADVAREGSVFSP